MGWTALTDNEVECDNVYKVVLTFHFCRDKEGKLCNKVPLLRYYAIESILIDLRDYTSLDDVVEHVLDELESKVKDYLKDKYKVEAWRNGIRPYIYEHVWELLRDYFQFLYERIGICEGVLPEEVFRYLGSEYGYNRMYSRIELEEPDLTCECVDEMYALLTKFTEAYELIKVKPEEFIKWKYSKLSDCNKKVVEPVLTGDTPLESILKKYGLSKWYYEVYPTSKDTTNPSLRIYKRFKEITDKEEALRALVVMLQYSDMYRLGISSYNIPMIDADVGGLICSELLPDFIDWLIRLLNKPVAVLRTENGYHIIPLIELRRLDDIISKLGSEVSKILSEINKYVAERLKRSVTIDDIIKNTPDYVKCKSRLPPNVRNVITGLESDALYLTYQIELVRKNSYYTDVTILPYYEELYSILKRFAEWKEPTYRHVLFTQRCVDKLHVDLTLSKRKTTLRISGKPCKPYDIKLIDVFTEVKPQPSIVVTVTLDSESYDMLYKSTLKYGVPTSEIIRAYIRRSIDELKDKDTIMKLSEIKGSTFRRNVRIRKLMLEYIDNVSKIFDISRSELIRACIKYGYTLNLTANEVVELGKL